MVSAQSGGRPSTQKCSALCCTWRRRGDGMGGYLMVGHKPACCLPRANQWPWIGPNSHQGASTLSQQPPPWMARCHLSAWQCTASHIASGKNWLTENSLSVLPWPPYSPDLNIIENLWSVLELCIQNCRLYPSNITQLSRYLEEEWHHIPPLPYAIFTNPFQVKLLLLGAQMDSGPNIKNLVGVFPFILPKIMLMRKVWFWQISDHPSNPPPCTPHTCNLVLFFCT